MTPAGVGERGGGRAVVAPGAHTPAVFQPLSGPAEDCESKGLFLSTYGFPQHLCEWFGLVTWAPGMAALILTAILALFPRAARCRWDIWQPLFVASATDGPNERNRLVWLQHKCGVIQACLRFSSQPLEAGNGFGPWAACAHGSGGHLTLHLPLFLPSHN